MNDYPDLREHKYEIIRELGRNREGGRVSYLATKEQTITVVIKQFRFLSADSSWHGYKVYDTEVNLLKELNHPRIPKYIDSFETEDGFCLVQEYKDAPALVTINNLSPEQIKKIAISILEILSDLQQRKPPIIHRDLKPENILIDSEFNAYLIDFGLAKKSDQDLAISSIAMGTPGFMPPEEVFNRQVTPASDLYSLGATLICLLTNTPSVQVSSLIDDNYRFNFQEQLSELNPLLIQWLSRMVEPNLKERFPDATTALNTLKAIDIYAQLIDLDKHNAPENILPTSIISIIIIILSIILLIGSTIRINKQTSKLMNTNLSLAQQWFRKIKPHCNSVEVVTSIERFPVPRSTEGIGYAAACYALAGKIQMADQLIQALEPSQQQEATNIVFAVVHSVADREQAIGKSCSFYISGEYQEFCQKYSVFE